MSLKKQPLAIGLGCFILMLTIGCFYSAADYKETLSSYWGWRKILLLPLALSLFEETLWKDRFLKICVNFIFLSSVLSILSFIFDFGVYDYEPGIVLRNYATQGMVYAVSIFVIVMQFIHQKKFIMSNEWPKICHIISLLVSLTFMTAGRSGYLALIILSIYFCYRVIALKKNYWTVVFVSLLIPLLLLNSNIVKERVKLGVNEIASVDTPQGQETSMGLRVTAWRNTINMIKEHPILGAGTGGFETAYVNFIKNQADGEKFLSQERFLRHDPHNQFLKIFAEFGMIGFFIFLAFLASALLQKVSSFYLHLSFGILMAWFATSQFSSHFSTFTEGRFIFLWLGVLLAYKKITKSI